MDEIKYTEHDLSANLNELAHEALRELFLAAKKVMVYSSTHPLAQKAISRAFFQMEKIFKFKRYFDIKISSGHLYVLNIMTRTSIFTDQVMDFMQMHDINSILFDANLTVRDFSAFLERFVKRLSMSDFKNILANYLKEKNIDTILIDSDIGERLFKGGHRYQGDIPGDFSVRKIVGHAIGDNFDDLANLLEIDEINFDEYYALYQTDFYPQLAAYLIPEKIALLESDRLVQFMADIITKVIEKKRLVKDFDPELLKQAKNLVHAINYHSKREEIIDRVGALMVVRGISKDIYSAILPQANSIKVESSKKIDGFLYSTFNEALPGYQLEGFNDLFSRLLRTGQQSKSQSVVNILLNHLSGPNLDLRKKSLLLFRIALEDFPIDTGEFLLTHTLKKIDEYIEEGKETFEFSDLIWELARIALSNENYEFLSSICDTLSKRRCQSAGIWTYDSVAVKKAVEELNRQEVIQKLVNDLLQLPSNQAQYIRNILITIGSHEAAMALAEIISHDSRQVRQSVLKALSEMGKSALHVCTVALNNNSLFTRESGKRELPDEKWYIVRNCIFVLGSLKDPEGCRALRIRMNESDTRVRRAIVKALEKIGGESATDLLILAADDPDNEIREAAIIALGFVGSGQVAPELIAMAGKHTSDSINIINNLGRLGGAQARAYLLELLNNRDKQAELTSSRSSRDDLKLATIKALGRIGDEESLDKIQEFNNSLSASSKIFFGAAKLTKAADEILKRKK